MSESENKQIKYKNLLIIMVSAVTPILFLLFVYLFSGMTFEQNDDLFISRILSGTITGIPDFHAVQIGFWISAPISFLYRISGVFPWWGLFLIVCFVLSRFCINYNFTNEDIKRLVFVPVLDLFLSLSYIYFAGKTQYTSVSILLAAAGYACIVLGKEKKRDLILFFILEFLAFGLRQKGMLLVQPFGILMFISGCIVNKKKFKSQTVKILICFLLIGLTGIFGKLASGELSGEWKDYYSFNKMREEFYDYSGCPDYEEVRDILEKYGVSEVEWDAFKDYDLSVFPIDSGLNNELYEYAKEKNRPDSFSNILKNIYLNSIRRKDAWPILILFGVSVLTVLLLSEYKGFIILAGFWILHFSIWFYMCLRGRIIDRVSLPFLMAECLFLLYFIFGCISDKESIEKLSSKKKKFGIASASAFLILFIAVSIFVGTGHIKRLKEDVFAQKILWESMRQIEDYCDAHPEKKYFVDISSVSSVHGETFTKEKNRNHNYMYSGGWFSATPSFKKRKDEYLNGCDSFCYIVFDFGEGWNRMEQGSAEYYKYATGSSGTKTDEISVSSGGTFLVYEFDKTN